MDLQAVLARLREYEAVIDTMNCGLVADDLDGTVVFINARLLEWLSYEKEEVEGQHISMLTPPELHALVEEDIRGAEQGDLRARLLAVRRKDSTTFPVVTLPQRLFDADGKLEGYFSIVVDLGAVLTAKQMGPTEAVDVRATLSRIAMELQSICLAPLPGVGPALPLHHPDLHGLSSREVEVLSMLMVGDRVPAIAKRLHISPHTVRNHLKSMYRKLDVGSQSELIERVRKLSARDAPEEAPTGS
jgi:PAS domain S-box-containing protein